MGEQGLGRIASRRAPDAGILAVALFVALATYRRAIDTSFAQDDITFLSRAAGLEHAGAPFHPLSARAPDVVCKVNQAYLSGLLDGLGATSAS